MLSPISLVLVNGWCPLYFMDHPEDLRLARAMLPCWALSRCTALQIRSAYAVSNEMKPLRLSGRETSRVTTCHFQGI